MKKYLKKIKRKHIIMLLLFALFIGCSPEEREAANTWLESSITELTIFDFLMLLLINSLMS